MNIFMFKDLLESKLSGYEVFLVKATEYQNEKNKKRAKDKRWDERKIERTVNSMWNTVARNTFDKVRTFKKCPSVNCYKPIETWTAFMESEEVFDMLDTELSEIEFE